MANIHRVLWGEGVFLRPQHFQQQALYSEWLGQNAARLAVADNTETRSYRNF